MSAFDWFVEIKSPDIQGEAKDSAHKDWIEILSISHQIKVPRDYESARSTGRRQHGDFVITKYIDKATPLLLKALVQNEKFKMKVEGMRADGDKRVKYFEINFVDAVIADYQTETPPGGTDLPKERWALKYTSIEWIYTQQKRSDGISGGSVSASDSLTTANVS